MISFKAKTNITKLIFIFFIFFFIAKCGPKGNNYTNECKYDAEIRFQATEPLNIPGYDIMGWGVKEIFKSSCRVTGEQKEDYIYDGGEVDFFRGRPYFNLELEDGGPNARDFSWYTFEYEGTSITSTPYPESPMNNNCKGSISDVLGEINMQTNRITVSFTMTIVRSDSDEKCEELEKPD